jgi:hypothetical protein
MPNREATRALPKRSPSNGTYKETSGPVPNPTTPSGTVLHFDAGRVKKKEVNPPRSGLWQKR